VVESIGIEPNDVGLAALVFAMTMPAAALFCERILAVKALPVLPVGSDFVMTIQAEKRLRIPAEGCVAPVAVFLVLLVRLVERPWHDEFFKQRLCRKGRRKRRK